MRKLVGALSLVIIMLLVLSCKPDGNAVPDANNPDSNIPIAFSVGDPIWDLLFDGDEMWVGTTGGVVRCDLKKETTQKYTIQDGLGSNVSRKLGQDTHGNIWVTGYLAGVSCFDGTRWQNFTVSNGLISDDVITLEADSKGGVWVSAYWGVSYYDGTQWQAFTNVPPDTLVTGGKNPNNPEATLIEDVELSAVDVIFIDSRGDVWFNNRHNGVTRFNGENWELFSTEDGLAEGGVSAITEDKDGNLWFGSMKGITCFDGSQFQVFTIKEYQSIIPRPQIQDILQDQQGNIWVAAYGGGAIRYDKTSWLVFTHTGGLPSDNVRSIHLYKEGSIGVITDKGVSRFKGTGWQTLTTEDGLPDGEIRVVVTDDDGNLWFGGTGGEIRRIQ
ncbi:MAG: two-component regulator propeller domain-containing protein [Dehalococcoidales bacterium]|nr:two-component regulator propeller domain-containing protein [Dehalococcoidales bacterium]